MSCMMWPKKKKSGGGEFLPLLNLKWVSFWFFHLIYTIFSIFLGFGGGIISQGEGGEKPRGGNAPLRGSGGGTAPFAFPFARHCVWCIFLICLRLQINCDATTRTMSPHPRHPSPERGRCPLSLRGGMVPHLSPLCMLLLMPQPAVVSYEKKEYLFLINPVVVRGVLALPPPLPEKCYGAWNDFH